MALCSVVRASSDMRSVPVPKTKCC